MKKKLSGQHLVKLYRGECFGSPDIGYGPERMVRAFEDVNEDYLIVADRPGMKRSTARSVVWKYVREGRIAERPKTMLGSIMRRETASMKLRTKFTY